MNSNRAISVLRELAANRLVDVRVDTDDGTPAFALLRFRDPFHQLLTGTGIGIGTPQGAGGGHVTEAAEPDPEDSWAAPQATMNIMTG